MNARRRTLPAALIISLTICCPLAKAGQNFTATIHSQHYDCDSLGDLAPELNQRSDKPFVNWNEADFQAADSLAQACFKGRWGFGKKNAAGWHTLLTETQQRVAAHAQQQRQERLESQQRQVQENQQRDQQEAAAAARRKQWLATSHRPDMHEGREARLLIVPSGRIDLPGPRLYTGSIVSTGSIFTILFTKEPCPLPIEGAETMHRAWQRAGAYQVGCWYPTMEGGYVLIDGAGRMTKINSAWAYLPRGLLHPDGNTTITEPDYDSDTFIVKAAQQRMHEMQSHTDEQP